MENDGCKIFVQGLWVATCTGAAVGIVGSLLYWLLLLK